MNLKKIIKNTEIYFSKLINLYNSRPIGVGWNSKKAQEIRQNQVLKIIKNKKNFSINDIGCGYGHLYNFLKKKNYKNFFYLGYDISPKMIEIAKKKIKSKTKIKFKVINSLNNIKISDYSVASGVFNVKQNFKNIEWQKYICKSLKEINMKSTKGFSFNMLTSYSNKKLMRNDLYYGNPLFYFNFCIKNFSRNVTLIHDYNLYDFTILVRKNEH